MLVSRAGRLFRKAKKRVSRRQPSILKKISGDIPIANWFKENPLGNLVALFLLFLTVYLWTTGLATNPYLNDANFVSQWSQFYNNTSWMLKIAIPGFLMAVALSAIHDGAHKESLSPRLSGLMGLNERIKASRARLSAPKVVQPEGMKEILGGKVAGGASDQGVG